MELPLGDLEDLKKKAFSLFEQGKYEESHAICRELEQRGRDPSVSVLCAANLFHMGHLEEAEAFFRDLAHTLPGTSHVHSYLGRIMEKKGCAGALAEYARAILLDPTNTEALRSFATLALQSDDPGRGLPVLVHLYSLSHRTDDARLLARALLLTQQPSRALEVWKSAWGATPPADEDTLAILWACDRFAEVSRMALALYEQSGNASFARRYLTALSRMNDPNASGEYRRLVDLTGDPGIRYDYALFLKDKGYYEDALGTLEPLLGDRGMGGHYGLLWCEIVGCLKRRDDALRGFRELVERELDSMVDLDFIPVLLSRFRAFLQTHYPAREAESILLSLLSERTDPHSLLTVGMFYEDMGDLREARSWYFRAYRSDFLRGGPTYARFCYRTGETRECEKVLIYVVNSTKRVPDLLTLTETIIKAEVYLLKMPRLLERLKERLEVLADSLPSRGMELLARICLLWGSVCLERGEYMACKRACLVALDCIPPGFRDIIPEDILSLLKDCKRKALCEIPVIPLPKQEGPETPETNGFPPRDLDLDENERKIIELLAARGLATERELRLQLGTRRVTGIVNRIIQKASRKGLVLIEKRGYGKDGEVYAYRRT
ncbi:MAG: hypothetical protein NQU46_08715 [Methanolinea sp.]|nr:hypothetical protein [Methanolinea sp.]